MALAKKSPPKRGRGRPATGVGTPVQVRLNVATLAGLDRLAKKLDATRPAAVRHALVEWLTDRGFLKKRAK